jgi:hypothetical protein
MLIIQKIDLIIAGLILIVCIMVIAKKRSALQFTENSDSILRIKENRRSILNAITSRPVLFIIVPLIQIVLGLYSGIISHIRSGGHMVREVGSFFVQFGFIPESPKDYLLYFYQQLSHYSEQVLFLKSFYKLLIIPAPFILLIYILVKKNSFTRKDRTQIIVLFLFMLVVYALNFTIMAGIGKYTNEQLVSLISLFEIPMGSYTISILMGVLLRQMIASFKGNTIPFFKCLDESIRRNGSMFVVILVYNLILYVDIFLFKNATDNTAFEFQKNSFNILKIILSIVVPVLLIRMVMYTGKLPTHIKLGARFVIEHLAKTVKYLLLFIPVKIVLESIGKLFLTPDVPWPIFAFLYLFRNSLTLTVALLLFGSYVYIIYKISLSENDQMDVFFNHLKQESSILPVTT